MEKFRQFIKFGIVGCTNTAVSYLVYAAVLFLMKPLAVSWDYVVGNVIAFLISVLWSFHWNEKYVFQTADRDTKARLKALLKTYISYGFSGLILSNVLSWFWISYLGVNKLIAPLMNLVLTVPINFLLNKLWAFR